MSTEQIIVHVFIRDPKVRFESDKSICEGTLDKQILRGFQYRVN